MLTNILCIILWTTDQYSMYSIASSFKYVAIYLLYCYYTKELTLLRHHTYFIRYDNNYYSSDSDGFLKV